MALEGAHLWEPCGAVLMAITDVPGLELNTLHGCAGHQLHLDVGPSPWGLVREPTWTMADW